MIDEPKNCNGATNSNAAETQKTISPQTLPSSPGALLGRPPSDQANAEIWLSRDAVWRHVEGAVKQGVSIKTLVAQIRELIVKEFSKPTDLSNRHLSDAIRAVGKRTGGIVNRVYGDPDRPDARRAGRPRKESKIQDSRETTPPTPSLSAKDEMTQDQNQKLSEIATSSSVVVAKLDAPVRNGAGPALKSSVPTPPPSNAPVQRVSAASQSPSYQHCHVCGKPMSVSAFTASHFRVSTCENSYCAGAIIYLRHPTTSFLCPVCGDAMEPMRTMKGCFRCIAFTLFGKKWLFNECQGRRDSRGRDISPGTSLRPPQNKRHSLFKYDGKTTI